MKQLELVELSNIGNKPMKGLQQYEEIMKWGSMNMGIYSKITCFTHLKTMTNA